LSEQNYINPVKLILKIFGTVSKTTLLQIHQDVILNTALMGALIVLAEQQWVQEDPR
jgi:hypothetical protein